MCRIKYGELCIIPTKDEEIKVMLFKNLKEMAEQLKVLAKTKDKEIRYVDIYVPVPLLQVSTFQLYVHVIYKRYKNY